MKITYLANVRMPTERAYGVQIMNMCRAFAAQGVEVSLLYPYRTSRAIRQDIFEYYRIPKTFRARRLIVPDFYLPGILNRIAFHIKNLWSAIALASHAAAESAQLVYSRDELPLFILSFFRNNLAFEAHVYSPARAIYYRRFKKSGIRIIVISNALKQKFIVAGFKEEAIVVAHDAVDLKHFDIPLSRDEARNQIGLPLDTHIVMYSGHLFEKKGVNVLAEAARLVPGAVFVFVGGTDREVEGFRKKYADQENMQIVGHRPYADIPLYLHAADVLVLPNSGKEDVTDRFTSPLKLFEYMASRRPIIASDLPVLREVLHDANAVLVPADQSSVLAEAISRLLSDSELRLRLADQAFKDVAGHTWDGRAQLILSYYR
jgi:glycosyltransferase involved in cell wall biosynthesis